MALPADLTTITVTGTYTPPYVGGPAPIGTVTVTLPSAVQDPAGQVILQPGTFPAPLNTAGGMSIQLVCTDNDTLDPENFRYLVTEQIPGLGRAYWIQLPSTLGATVDLSQLAPVSPPPSATAFASSNTWTGTQTWAGSPPMIVPGGADGDVLTLDADGNVTPQPGGGGGGGDVDSVTAGDDSITIGGTGTQPTVETGRLDQIAALHPAGSAVTMNGQRVTNVANGTASTDAVAFGQLGSAAFAGTAAFDPAGTAASVLAASLQKSANLADLGNAGSARANLGLASAALQPATAFDAAGAANTAQSNAETYAAAQAGSAQAASLPVTGGTATGSVVIQGALSTTPVTLTDGTAITVNAATSGYFRVTLGGNRTLSSPSNPTDGQPIVFEIIQDTTGSRTLAYGAAYSFPTSIGTPVLSAAPSAHDFLAFRYDTAASLWYCVGFVPQQATASAAVVAQGGTGEGSFTPFMLLTGGTSPTSPLQQVAAAGTAGWVLTSNGAGSLPSFQAASGGTGLTNPMTTLGDLIAGGTTGTAIRLAGNTSSTREFLRSAGTAGTATAPVWDTLQSGDLPAAGTAAAGAVILNGTPATITVPGSQAAGASGLAADAAHVHPVPGQWFPADNNLLAATDAPGVAVSSTTPPTAGTLYLTKLPVRSAMTATSLWFVIGAAGTGVSTGSFLGLYSSGGTLLASTAEIGTQITTGFVARQIALGTAQTLTSGSFVWVALLTNLATAQPALRQLNNGTVLPNLGLTAATYRFCTAGTSLTALPASITPASNVAPSISPYWFGVS